MTAMTALGAILVALAALPARQAGSGPTFTHMEIDVDKVRLHGDVAVVTGRSVSAGRVGDRDIEVVQRYTDVFVRRDGHWRVVASQGTQVQ